MRSARKMKNGRKKVTGIIMTLFLTSTILNFASPIAYGSSVPTFYVDPSSVIDPSLTSGDSFVVDVNVSDAIDLFAWQIYISWDAMVLDATDIVCGDFLAAQPLGAPNFSLINNSAGWLMIAQTTIGQYSGVDGDGWLCSITFLVETLGETVLDIDSSFTSYVDSLGTNRALVKHGGFFSNIGVSTTELIMNETTSSTHALTETIICQSATLNTSVIGDFDAALDFANLEIVLINSGSFAGKGFSTGNWSTNIEGNPYEGSWQGVLFKKPEERKIYLKGMVSGGLRGIVEGFLSESVNGSEIYDRYQATWTINHIGTDIVFAKLDLNGTVNYQDSIEYSSELYALQTSIEGEASGYYNGSLTIVLTHVRIDNETNPYYGEGFSIISYVSEYGSGEGWAYDRLISPSVVELNGLFTDPLVGIVSGTLDESGSPRTLSISIERIDLGLPPMADLKARVWGPTRVSPGQTIDYIIEYRNDGLKAAENIAIVYLPPFPVDFISASPPGSYDDVIHVVRWDFNNIPPRTVAYLSVRVRIFWALPLGDQLPGETYLFSKEEADSIFQHESPSLTEKIKLILHAIFSAITTGVGYTVPDENWAEAGGALPVIIRRLRAVGDSTENFEYNMQVIALMDAIHRGLSLDTQGWTTTDGALHFPAGTPRDEIISQLKQHYGYTPTDAPNKLSTTITTAHDPNIKYGPEGYVLPEQELDYKVEYENEGEGIAFGVYFTDTLDKDLDDSTLGIGPVFSTEDSSVIADPGTYNPSLRTITWFVGEVGPGEGGYANFSAQVKNDVPEYTEIINYATVYFPSVPETTRTNAIVSVVGQPNIAVTNVTPSEHVIEKGFTQDINVIVANEGYYPETFNVTLYANTTAIQTQNITLLGRSSGIITFLWNTTGFAKSNYTLSAYAWPVLGEVETDNNLYVDGIVQVIVLDDVPPTTDLNVGEPKFVIDHTFYYLTSATPLTLIVEDDPGGSGVAATAYRIYNATYDGGWIAYTQPFYLIGLSDGVYSMDHNSTDSVGNVEAINTAALILDNTAPAITVLNPPPGGALQDDVTFLGSIVDSGSGVSSMSCSIREANDGDGIPIGFEDLPVSYDPSIGEWSLAFDTLLVPDGYYVLHIEAEDNLGNEASTTVPYSIRNWAVIELLPSSENNKAGRTMPVKFALRVAAEVDPDQPFVYNEELRIEIFATDDPDSVLQECYYGDTAGDYRISSALYITNFKTLGTPLWYTVMVCRDAFDVGSFEFETVK